MSWTKEDSAKLREYQTAQMTVAEIAEKMQKKKSDIRRELVSMGYLPKEIKPQPEPSEFLKDFKPVEIKRKPYAKITTSVEKRVCELRESCYTTTQIAQKLNIAQQTVSNILKRNGYSTKRGEYHKLSLEDITETKEDKPMKAAKVNEEFDKAVSEMIAEAKEKEPAPVATVTDSSREKEVLTNNDITEKPKCQALSGIKMMMELEAMLGEVYGRDVEIVSVSADAEHCDIGFAYHGREYSLLFAEREEVPSYGNDKH